MGRPRESNTDLPPLLHVANGRYYFKASSREIRKAVGAWSIALGADATIARTRWAELLAKTDLKHRVHPVKIGFTTARDITTRARELQTGAAEPLTVIGYTEGTVRQERLCHKRLSELRMSGEWFRPEPATLTFVNALVIQGVRRALLDF